MCVCVCLHSTVVQFQFDMCFVRYIYSKEKAKMMRKMSTVIGKKFGGDKVRPVYTVHDSV